LENDMNTMEKGGEEQIGPNPHRRLSNKFQLSRKYYANSEP
jgi:hypothetical protein